MAALIALALAACGRRGQPEAPPDPSVPAAQRNAAATVPTPSSAAGAGPAGAAVEEEDDGTETFVPRATPTPSRRGAKRGYVIPKDPFILDPLL